MTHNAIYRYTKYILINYTTVSTIMTLVARAILEVILLALLEQSIQQGYIQNIHGGTKRKQLFIFILLTDERKS